MITEEQVEEVRRDSAALLPDELRHVVIEYGLDLVAALLNDIYDSRPACLMLARLETSAEELLFASCDLASVPHVEFHGHDFLLAAFTVEDKDMSVYHYRFADGNVLSFPFVRLRDKWTPLFFGVQVRPDGLSPIAMTGSLPERQSEKFLNFFDQSDSLRLAAYSIGSLLLFNKHEPTELH